jgi:hypothetical protein
MIHKAMEKGGSTALQETCMKVSIELKFDISLKEAAIQIHVLDISCKKKMALLQKRIYIFVCLVTKIQGIKSR